MNKEYNRIRMQEWRKNNKERNLLNGRKSDNKRFMSPKGMFGRYGQAAKTKKISFALSFEEFKSFWQEPCHYCGSEIETVGIDRVDNRDGYNVWNCVPCCSICNYMKKNLTASQFINHCRKVVPSY